MQGTTPSAHNRHHVQSLQRHQRPGCHHRAHPRFARYDRQPSVDARCVSRLHGAGGAQQRYPRIGDAPMGHARAASVWRRADHEYSQRPKSPHWRGWLKPENRCVVPFTSFCEYADTKPRKTPTWFAFDETRPLACFAGIWTTWKGTRGPKSRPETGDHQLFGFLTTDANAEVGAIHPKAMPVILRTDDEIETWMTAPAEEALKLQRPLPNGALKVVMTGKKEDKA